MDLGLNLDLTSPLNLIVIFKSYYVSCTILKYLSAILYLYITTVFLKKMHSNAVKLQRHLSTNDTISSVLFMKVKNYFLLYGVINHHYSFINITWSHFFQNFVKNAFLQKIKCMYYYAALNFHRLITYNLFILHDIKSVLN